MFLNRINHSSLRSVQSLSPVGSIDEIKLTKENQSGRMNVFIRSVNYASINYKTYGVN